MSIYGYEINTSLDLYRKLLDEREDLLKCPNSSRFAMNCALTGWHLHEWVYKEFRESSPLNAFKNCLDFRMHLYQKCASLHTFRDLADGSKHFSLENRDSSIISTTVEEKGSKWGFNKLLEQPTLVVTILLYEGADARIAFDDLLYDVTSFWTNYLHKIFNLDTASILKNYSGI